MNSKVFAPFLNIKMDNVLFSDQVHFVQDPDNGTYNLDPYLKSITHTKDFDCSKLPPYITAADDKTLFQTAQLTNQKYYASTSSITTALTLLHFLSLNTHGFDSSSYSDKFSKPFSRFTRRTVSSPVLLSLKHSNGHYGINNITYSSATPLMDIGNALEKFLILPEQKYNQYMKHSNAVIDTSTPEAYNYSIGHNFLLRAQLDCQDNRLPKSTFDLKTRATVAMRHHFHDKDSIDYPIDRKIGFYKSFEREEYDMMRSTMIKYALQARIGDMDGILVCYHNTAQIFGFQYYSLNRMDKMLFKSSRMAEEAFAMSLKLLNEIFEKVTSYYPNQNLEVLLQLNPAANDQMIILARPFGNSEVVNFSLSVKSYINNIYCKSPALTDDNENWTLDFKINKKSDNNIKHWTQMENAKSFDKKILREHKFKPWNVYV